MSFFLLLKPIRYLYRCVEDRSKGRDRGQGEPDRFPTGLGPQAPSRNGRSRSRSKGRSSSQLCEAQVEVSAEALRNGMQTDRGHDATPAMLFCVRDQAGYPARHCQKVQERTLIFSTHRSAPKFVHPRIDSEVSPSWRAECPPDFIDRRHLKLSPQGLELGPGIDGFELGVVLREVSRCFVPSGPAVVAFLRARMLRQRHGVSLLVPRRFV